MRSRFHARKRVILEQLGAPDEQYHDSSPKGSIDEPIRTLIDEINQLEGLVTTSSCSGRISVFLEGRKRGADESGGDSSAGPGGKGGGTWLFVSHNQIPQDSSFPTYTKLFGLQIYNSGDSEIPAGTRYIHLKFEPMILHILTASVEDSQRVLNAALSAGFRESGALSLIPKDGEANPMVAVRSTGYAFDAIVGYQNIKEEKIALVDEIYLQTLVSIAHQRFKINKERILRFRSALLEQYGMQLAAIQAGLKPDWEDPEIRKRRKREEGLARQRALRAEEGPSQLLNDSDFNLDGSGALEIE